MTNRAISVSNYAKATQGLYEAHIYCGNDYSKNLAVQILGERDACPDFAEEELGAWVLYNVYTSQEEAVKCIKKWKMLLTIPDYVI